MRKRSAESSKLCSLNLNNMIFLLLAALYILTVKEGRREYQFLNSDLFINLIKQN